MSCIQASTTGNGKPSSLYLPNRAQRLYCTARRANSLKPNARAYKHGLPELKCQQKSAAVCLLGGKDKSEDEKAPWKDFGKAMENLGKGKSIEDVLREQMEKQEFYDGNGGKSPPRRGGGGGDGDGSGESGDEGFAGIMDETLQVILATTGFIFLYVYIISGEEMTRLAKDYVKYLFGGSKSVRLKNAMYTWERFWKRLSEKKIYDKSWLEKAIINTPTWFDHPEEYRRVLRSYMTSQNAGSEDRADAWNRP